MKQSVFLLSAIILGIIIPQASKFSYLIYYLLMFMLFFTFLQWKITTQIFREKKIYLVLLINIIIGLGGYFLLIGYNQNFAIIAFLIGITPTATACPAVMGYLKGRIDFTIATVVVTNVFMALFIPFIIYRILDLHLAISTIFSQIILVIFIPLILGQVIRNFFPKISNYLSKFKNIGFYSWLIVCFIAVSKASLFIQNSEVDKTTILLIGGIAGLICLLNFNIGRIVGGKDLSLEMSQTLGQKNTTLAIWIGLTYFNPLIALGPIFYLVWHNLYNSYQLAMQSRKNYNKEFLFLAIHP